MSDIKCRICEIPAEKIAGGVAPVKVYGDESLMAEDTVFVCSFCSRAINAAWAKKVQAGHPMPPEPGDVNGVIGNKVIA